MRLFIFIFSIYILVLSCIPCTDAEGAANNLIKTEQLTSSNPDHLSPQPDFCSPLCICNCCNVHVVPVTTTFPAVFHPLEEYIFPNMITSLHPSAAAAIWQPPRTVIG
ncbi:hypothetical protein CLV59_106309 [Chitinophaga dinghuensis]|uniref:Uncharacterized protein n=1 Tax=Chitinophaga dinghuensis TaxID=1539050 RepID=A0A327W2R7_9BACT|nr:DUF6660 family protein [Chitinophaga dinghuensis]RAJ79248.1 hypothetical protein CLV59_106309 [Chitinophaga dinghuensis]